MDKSLPSNIDVERHLLGACLSDRDAILSVRNIVGLPDFILEKHAQIYEAMLDCIDRKQPSDIALVSEELRRRGRLELVGGIAFLGELVYGMPQPPEYNEYAQIVAKLAARRRVIEKAGRLAADAWDESTPLDHVISDFTEELKLERRIRADSTNWQARVTDSSLLWAADFVPRPFIVDEILPVGVTLLHGLPKCRKSWFGKNIAFAVACGGKALGHLQAQRGEVLYINLEMDQELIQERLKVMFPHERPPKGVFWASEWPALDEGMLDHLDNYLEARPFTKLVVVDTMVRILPDPTRSSDFYRSDAKMLDPITKFCGGRGIAMLMIHHSRKGNGGGDPIMAASGSTGITATVDSILELSTPDFSDRSKGKLGRSGRRLRVTDDMPLQWDDMLGQWNYMERGPTMTPERRIVLELLRSRPGLTPKQIATITGRDDNGTRRLMTDMQKANLVVSMQGAYFVADESPPMA